MDNLDFGEWVGVALAVVIAIGAFVFLFSSDFLGGNETVGNIEEGGAPVSLEEE